MIRHLTSACLLFTVTLGCPWQKASATTLSPTASHAYAANAGWINLRPGLPTAASGIEFGEYLLSGQAWSANLGWMDLGDGAPADGIQYSNTSASDFGVNHDGRGNLTGFAYAANVGWISFSWSTTTDPARPRVDLRTGEFLGYAYGANIGWIHLGGGFLRTLRMTLTDTDTDGLADEWERLYFGSITVAGTTSDSDHDGLSDADEYLAGTAPDDAKDHFHVLSTVFESALGRVTLTFATEPTRHYRIESSTTLAPGSWTDSGLGSLIPDAGHSTTRTFTVPASARRFFRIVAVLPLRP